MRPGPWPAALLTAFAASAAIVAAPGPCTQAGANCQSPDQAPHGAGNVLGVASDDNPEAGFRARDNFLAAASGTIDGLCWWGFYLDFDTPGACGGGTVADTFTVTYFNNDVGIPPRPGSIRAGPFDVTSALDKAPTGQMLATVFGLVAEYGFTATHQPFNVSAGECLWVEVRNNTAGSSPPCIWLWSTAPPAGGGGIGDALSWQNSFENDFDLAFCADVTLGDPGGCALQINPGCLVATNPCSQASALPGCSDEVCCSLVCESLPLCCQAAWSASCVSAAASLCTQCGAAGTGNCFIADFTPYCDDSCNADSCIGCCAKVCATDPFCCDTAWDGFCVFTAQQVCPCGPGAAPANDQCSGAITLGLGTFPFNNACGTAGPPSHASCNDGNLVGLGVDVWYRHTATFSGQLLVSTCNQINFDSQIAVYAGCSCAALSDPPLACNNDGGVCGGGTSMVVVPVVSGQCYTIRVGSTFADPVGAGTLTLSAEIPQPCDIGPPPPGAAEEGEPCGQDLNGGCSMPSPAFTAIALGQTVHGTAWAATGTRDTDWFQLPIASPTEVTVSIEAEFPFVVGFAATSPGGSGNCANHTGFVSPSTTGEACTSATLTTTLGTGTWWPYVAPLVFDGLPCAAGVLAGNDYVLSVTVGEPCPWDCGGQAPDGTVNTVDFLALLQAWGSAGGRCDLGLGAPGVGVEEFLALLKHWGTCP
jgi:hypothetical protein